MRNKYRGFASSRDLHTMHFLCEFNELLQSIPYAPSEREDGKRLFIHALIVMHKRLTIYCIAQLRNNVCAYGVCLMLHQLAKRGRLQLIFFCSLCFSFLVFKSWNRSFTPNRQECAKAKNSQKGSSTIHSLDDSDVISSWYRSWWL